MQRRNLTRNPNAGKRHLTATFEQRPSSARTARAVTRFIPGKTVKSRNLGRERQIERRIAQIQAHYALSTLIPVTEAS